MKDEYDFSKGKRGAVLRPGPGKTRITIRIDDDVLEWFRKAVHEAGGGSYQSMINQALRDHVENATEPLEETLRRVLKEVLPAGKKAAPRKAKKSGSRTKSAAGKRRT
jgi:Arc/MetJ family transcription regulator